MCPESLDTFNTRFCRPTTPTVLGGTADQGARELGPSRILGPGS